MQPQQPNTPPGYAQPQYAQPPYPGAWPPPKKGMPWWAWLLIIGGIGFVMLLVMGILALAAIPLITSNTRDARRAEGEHLMLALRNHVRIAWAKMGPGFYVDRLTGPTSDSPPSGAGVSPDELLGKYFVVSDEVGGPPTSTSGRTLTCNPAPTAGVVSDGRGELTFDAADSNRQEIRWH